MNKYHAKKVTVDGIKFDSVKEYGRWVELKRLEQTGVIRDLKRQVKFELVPAQYEPYIITATGKRKRGRIIERPVTYIADFVYTDFNGQAVVEDAKGFKTEAYKIKRKLMLERHGIRVKEV